MKQKLKVKNLAKQIKTEQQQQQQQSKAKLSTRQKTKRIKLN